MKPLRACLLALAVFSSTVGVATAQSPSIGPDVYSLVPGLPVRGSVWLRGEDTVGLKWARSDHSMGLRETRRTALYADWFPFASSSFRVVGGLSFLDGPISPGASAYGASLGMRSLAGVPRTPSPSTYLGVGYGQFGPGHKGLGFYADMGLSVGALAPDADAMANSNVSLGGDGWRNPGSGWLGLRFQPSVSLGLVYRY
jgi:hypothetical protein